MLTDICFDLDGTLTDPFEGITRCIAFALEKEGIEVRSLEDLRWCIGPPLLGSLSELAGGDSAAGQRMLGYYRERFGSVGMLENEVFDGIEELLWALRGRGLRLWVVTSKPTVYAKPILEHFGLVELFDGVYGAELDGRFSDKKELMQFVIETRKIDVDSAVMIGDRRHDFEAAQSVGMRSIGVAWGYGGAEELGIADEWVTSVSELSETLITQLRSPA